MSRFALNRTRPHSIASYANQSYLTSYLKSYLKKKRTVFEKRLIYKGICISSRLM